MSTNSLIGKKVAIGIRYVSEMGAVEGLVLAQDGNGITVRVKKNVMFLPWMSVVYVRVDE